MNHPTNIPTRKVGAAGVAGAVTTCIVYILAEFGIVLPPEIVAALVTLISFGAGYLTVER